MFLRFRHWSGDKKVFELYKTVINTLFFAYNFLSIINFFFNRIDFVR